MGLRQDGDLLHAQRARVIAQLLRDHGAVADHGFICHLLGPALLAARPQFVQRVLRGQQRQAHATVAVEPREGAGGENEARLRLVGRRQREDADGGLRRGVAFAGLIIAAIEFEGLFRPALADEGGETEGNAQIGGDLRAIIGTAEHEDFRRGRALRRHLQARQRMALGERLARGPGDDVAHIGGKALHGVVARRVQHPGGAPIAARRTAKAQINASGRDGVQHAELLGDFQRRVMGQHDARRAHANARGARGDGGDQNFGG